MLTTFQIRAARAGARFSLKETAQAIGIGEATLQRLESGKARVVPAALADTLLKIKAYYEKIGIEFLPDNGIRLPNQ